LIKNNRYEVSQFRDDFNKRVIICNPIMVERGFISQKGVLFIITEKPIAELPFDLESIIKIFSKLMALWLETLMLTTLSQGISNVFKAFGGNSEKRSENKDEPAIKKSEK